MKHLLARETAGHVVPPVVRDCVARRGKLQAWRAAPRALVKRTDEVRDGMGRAAALAAAIRLHDRLSHHLPGIHDRVGVVLGCARGLVALHQEAVFKNLYLFWVKIFALSFGMGVVSGVVMSYQFGTNWSVFSAITGSVIGRCWPMKC
jgi:hypothetical protein